MFLNRKYKKCFFLFFCLASSIQGIVLIYVRKFLLSRNATYYINTDDPASISSPPKGLRNLPSRRILFQLDHNSFDTAIEKDEGMEERCKKSINGNQYNFLNHTITKDSQNTKNEGNNTDDVDEMSGIKCKNASPEKESQRDPSCLKNESIFINSLRNMIKNNNYIEKRIGTLSRSRSRSSPEFNRRGRTVSERQEENDVVSFLMSYICI